MTPRTIQRNLRKMWERATADDIRDGADFYPRYHRLINDFAAFYDTPVPATTGAFVTLSPNNPLQNNLRSLATCQWAVRRGQPPADVTTFRKFRDRAMLYLQGGASFLDLAGGEKIRAFYDNIRFPYSSTRATIDGHMVCVMAGQDLTMKEALFKSREMGGIGYLEDELRRFARKERLPLPTVQAILWFARKRTANVHYSPQLDMIEPCPVSLPPFRYCDQWKAFARDRQSQLSAYSDDQRSPS